MNNNQKNTKETQKQNKNNAGNKKKKNSKISYFFMGIMIMVYIVLYLILPDKTSEAVKYVLNIFKEILPILLFVYIFMLIFSLINENKLKTLIEKAPKTVKYLLMSALGTVSHGPIYAWYPFLNDLHKKGLSKGTVGTFLYARGIKITLLPMLVYFFDLKYVVILTVTTIFFSLIEGIIIDLTCKKPHAL